MDIFYHEYFNCKKIEYDKNENFIPGVKNKLIKLPIVKYTNIKITEIKISLKNIVNTIINAKCQHFLTWNIINKYKKYSPDKFN